MFDTSGEHRLKSADRADFYRIALEAERANREQADKKIIDLLYDVKNRYENKYGDYMAKKKKATPETKSNGKQQLSNTGGASGDSGGWTENNQNDKSDNNPWAESDQKDQGQDGWGSNDQKGQDDVCNNDDQKSQDDWANNDQNDQDSGWCPNDQNNAWGTNDAGKEDQAQDNHDDNNDKNDGWDESTNNQNSGKKNDNQNETWSGTDKDQNSGWGNDTTNQKTNNKNNNNQNKSNSNNDSNSANNSSKKESGKKANKKTNKGSDNSPSATQGKPDTSSTSTSNKQNNKSSQATSKGSNKDASTASDQSKNAKTNGKNSESTDVSNDIDNKSHQEIKSQLWTAKLDLRLLERDKNKLEEEANTYRNERDQLIKKLATANQENDTLKVKVRGLTVDLLSANDEIHKLNERLDEMEAERRNRDRDINLTETKRKSMESKYRSYQQQIVDLQSELDSVKDERDNYASRNIELVRRNERLESDISHSKNLIKTLKEGCSLVENQAKTLEIRHDTVMMSKADLERELIAIKEESSRYITSISNLQKSNKQLADSFIISAEAHDKLKKEFERMILEYSRKLDSYKEENHRLVEANIQMRKLIDHMQKKR